MTRDGGDHDALGAYPSESFREAVIDLNLGRPVVFFEIT
jgi:hypothetical protein